MSTLTLRLGMAMAVALLGAPNLAAAGNRGLVDLAVPQADAQTQVAAVDTVDRIAAIVGNTLILDSEITEEVYARFPRGQGLPTDPAELAALRAQVLGELVDLELLFQRAQNDTTVQVTEDEVTGAVDQMMRNIRQQYPSDQAYRDDLRVTGFQSPDEYRSWLTERQRKQLVTNTLIEIKEAMGELTPVIPTERELRAYFEANKGDERRPETVSFRQILIRPEPSAEARASSRAKADSILLELRNGADFATAARRFSQDPGSRENGGSLGWFRRGAMHASFEAVAFSLRPGIVSEPVLTPYGYHLIQVERVQPAEISARHILITPEITQADADSARRLAEQVHAAVLAGSNVDSLQRLYQDPLEEREGRDLPIDRLPPVYAAALRELQAPAVVGEVLTVPHTSGEALRNRYAIILLDERLAEGPVRYEDVKDNIRRRLGRQMAQRRFIDALRKATYVEIRGP